MVRVIDDSQRRAARAAGIAGLLTMPLVALVNFGIHARLIVSGDAAATARNILAHEALFRVGIAGDLLYCAGLLVLLSALYVVLRPVGRTLALMAAFWRLVYALAWIVMTLDSLDALKILTGADSLRAFGPGQAPALARLSLSFAFDTYYAGLLFWGLASAACGYLWLKSRYIPRGLAAFGLASSAWCVACTLAFIAFPGFSGIVNLWWFDTPMTLFELATSVWLVVKGLRPPAADASASS